MLMPLHFLASVSCTALMCLICWPSTNDFFLQSEHIHALAQWGSSLDGIHFDCSDLLSKKTGSMVISPPSDALTTKPSPSSTQWIRRLSYLRRWNGHERVIHSINSLLGLHRYRVSLLFLMCYGAFSLSGRWVWRVVRVAQLTIRSRVQADLVGGVGEVGVNVHALQIPIPNVKGWAILNNIAK